MKSTITFEVDYVRAILFGRQTAGETHEFIEAVVKCMLEHSCMRVLVWVRSSRALFTVEKYGISGYFERLRDYPAHRVAMLADSEETRAAQEYIEVLARQHELNVRSFRSEAEAQEWLRGA